MKKKIIEEIALSKDKDLLAEVLRMLNDDLGDVSFAFSEKGEKFIQEGLDDLKEGRVYTHGEANRVFLQWKKK